MAARWPGVAVAAAIALLIGGGFAALFAAAGGPSSLAPIAGYLRGVLVFALTQATFSTAGSLLFGTALALAMARRRFPGRGLFMAALGAVAVLPAIVVVFATVAVFGRSGWLADGLAAAGLPPPPAVYGWPGILYAHILLNAPFVARVLIDALAAVPAEHGRLAEMLRFSPLDVARHLDWPVIRAEWPGLATLVFLLCFTSFAIVLSLGGGRATLEVAIYEALKLDLDFGRAAWLGLLQVAICLCVASALGRSARRGPAGHTARLVALRPDRRDRRLLLLDTATIAVAVAAIGPPLASIAAGAAAVPAVLDRDLAQAAVTSLAVGVLSAALACGMAVALGASARGSAFGGLFETLPVLVLAMPPFALAAGLFLLVRRVTEPSLAGYVLLPAINALSALPFAARFVVPALHTAADRYGRLADHLGLTGRTRWRIVEWPLLRRPLLAAAAMATALSVGDFGIVALFGGTDLRTLPYLLYERLGAYRIAEAGGVGFLLVAAAFALAWGSARLSDAPR